MLILHYVHSDLACIDMSVVMTLIEASLDLHLNLREIFWQQEKV
jgi:hypothetical protein